ncbi:MDR family MFS transporter [Paenibacillus humicus]|uniref:MDR family MFS transporter n=1 Tax=Paenibacillus humicus TaxID=412861 RepID=UPI000FDCCAD6|nr:MDR family MFS transporter [Paenibacillus humicus]
MSLQPSAASAARPAAGAATSSRIVLAGILIGLIFSELDETIVTTAMPTIIRDLHGMSLYGWVAGIYALALTAFMPILGKMADLFGRKKIYLACMALFIIGSIVSGASGSMLMLLVGRGIQGIGAGGLMPIAMLIMTDMYPVEKRAKLMALVGPIMFIPQLAGPLLGGVIVDAISWHWVFFINIPVGVVAAILIGKGLRESRGEGKPAIDWAGAALILGAIVSLLLTPELVNMGSYTWHSPLIVGLLAAGAVLLAAFVWVESRAKEPVIPLHLFRNRTIVALGALIFLTMLGIQGSLASFPFYAQHVIGLSPTVSGYMTLPVMAGGIGTSIAVGWVITRLPYKDLIVASLALPIAAFAMLSTIHAGTSIVFILAAFLLLGAGFGVLFGSDNLIVQESVDKRDAGSAIATVQLFQSFGVTIGFSLFGSLLSGRIESGIAGIADRLPAGSETAVASGAMPDGLSQTLVHAVESVYCNAFAFIFTLAGIIAAIAFAASWLLKRETLSSSPEPSGEEQAA